MSSLNETDPTVTNEDEYLNVRGRTYNDYSGYMDYEYTYTTPYAVDTSDGKYLTRDGDLLHISQDRSNMSTLSFIISATFVVPALTLIARGLSQLCNRKIKLFDYHHILYLWVLISCLLSSILDILNLFDNILNKDTQLNSGHSCYYIYVFEGTLNTSIGVGLCLVAMDILINIFKPGKLCNYLRGKSLRVHLMCFAILVLCFLVNDLPDMAGLISHLYIHRCWKGNAYGYHAHFIGILDLAIQACFFLTMISICSTVGISMTVRNRRNFMVVIPDFMTKLEEENKESPVPVEPILEDNPVCQSLESAERPSSDESNIQDDTRNLQKLKGRSNPRVVRLKHKSSLKMFRNKRNKINRDNISSESSGRENSGYMSDGFEAVEINVQPVDRKQGFMVQRSTRAVHLAGRKRIKSDTEIQNEVQKAKKSLLVPKKCLEKHVLYAFENFFTGDRNKLMSIPGMLNRDEELGESLIVNDDNLDEAETCFMEVYDDKNGIGNKKADYDLPKTSYRDVFSAENSEDEFGGKIKVENEGGMANNPEKLFATKRSNSEKGMLKSKATVYRRSSSLNLDLEKIQRNVDSTDNLEEVKVTLPDVDHAIDQSIKDRSDDSIDNILAALKELFEEKKQVVFLNNSLSGFSSGKVEKQVHWDSDLSSSKPKAKLQRISRGKGVLKKKTADVNLTNANEIKSEITVASTSQDESLKTNDNGEQSKTRSRGKISTNTREERSFSSFSDEVIEPAKLELSSEGRKKEILTFRQYNRKYLLKPFKDVFCLMVTYLCCMLPQVVLDLYRIIQTEHSMMDNVDGILAIMADVSMSFMLLAMSIVFLWRFRRRRNGSLKSW